MTDRIAAALMVVVTLALLAMLPAWRMTDSAPPDGFVESPAAFLARAEAFAGRHVHGEVVRPPPGEVPVVARRFEFWPALELEAGRRYRLHIATLDAVHSIAIDGRELLLVPGQTRVVEITPTAPLTLQCGEYCGLGHARMRGSITVVSAPAAAK